jgi:WhiB family redox-sensing transcriptional regulator
MHSSPTSDAILAGALGLATQGSGWMENANCRNMDVEIFFPEVGMNVDPFVAEVCGTCPVRWECMWFANETSTDTGYYGGMSPMERRRWRQKYGVSLGQTYAEWRDKNVSSV